MLDEYTLWKILQRNKTSPAGLALWLAWQMDLGGKDIAALTWDQLDLEAGTLRIAEQTLPLTQALCRSLREVEKGRGADPHVLCSAGGKGVDAAYLSRLTSALLRREGLEGVTLRQLRRGLREDQETALLHLAQQRLYLTGEDAAELLDLPGEAAGKCLRRLAERGKLSRLGHRYYASLPQDLSRTIRRHIAQHGFAYRQEIAQLLGVEERQCSTLLRRMVQRGEVVLRDRKYFLPEDSKK